MSVTREQRRQHRTVQDIRYDAYADRRQPKGTVATYVRVTGGELVRARLHLWHLARVLAARAMIEGGTCTWE